MRTLVIQHVATDPDRFEVVRLSDGKRTRAVEIPSPDSFPVEGRPHSNLSKELRWYLEEFLDYPFEPNTDVAERVLDSLRQWGEAAFNALFDNREGGGLLNAAVADGYRRLRLRISSDDPRILAWNWEALKDPMAEPFAQVCRIERKLNRVMDPAPLSKDLPKDCVNILLVTARPFDNDVRYRSISRLLVELAETRNLPAEVHVLRPPTLDRLQEHLRNRPNFYHILHFDGHGAYGGLSPEQVSGFTLKGPQGCLAFETADGKEDLVLPEQLSALLRDHAVPAVVLNACQSGMIDAAAKDPYASVAASLLKSGVRSVVAMAYSLYVTGAQVFLPAFYRSLFKDGKMENAVRAGRRQMLSDMNRTCVRGDFPLRDWLVPVLYQQAPLDFSFAATARPKSETVALPPEIEDEDNPYGFIGRDRPILDLERALRSKTPAVLIHGMGGIGKTTLAKGFVKWLARTQGLGKGCFWFAFNDVRNAESMINRMGEALFGGNFSLAPLDDRLEALASAMKEHRFLIVWDNFESVCGIEGTEVRPLMDPEQRSLLAAFLKKLRGGKTKVIVTSRSPEEWIRTERRKLDISGLDGEERNLFLNEIVDALGIRIRQDDPDLVRLMDLLNGHPLAMRVVLPLLETRTAASLIESLQNDLNGLGPDDDETSARLYATLELARKSLPQELAPLLILLGLHERFMVLNYFEAMARKVEESWTGAKVRRFADSLAHTGLLHERAQGVFELHPALTGYLRSVMIALETEDSRIAWTRAYVNVMGTLADDLVDTELPEQRFFFHFFGASFDFALNMAEKFRMNMHFSAILRSIALHAYEMRNFEEAKDLFLRLAQAEKNDGNEQFEAEAYNLLGMIDREKGNFDTAKEWFCKSLSISKKYGHENQAATTYHELGRICGEKRELSDAEKWYKKSLNIKEKCGDEHGAAVTYHQLGRISEEKGSYNIAEKWYQKSLVIKKKQGKQRGVALTCHQLGNIAYKKREFDAAERWYRESLVIKKTQENERDLAITYHQLGMVAERKEDFVTAEKLYRKSLSISEKNGDEYEAAMTYQKLGDLVREQLDYDTAEKWYLKSLKLQTKNGIEQEAASTCCRLGFVDQSRLNYNAAKKWYRKSLEISKNQVDELGAADAFILLGMVAELQGDLLEFGTFMIKGILAYDKFNKSKPYWRNVNLFKIICDEANAATRTRLKAMWAEAGLPPFTESESAPK